jgi:hypothetical protein
MLLGLRNLMTFVSLQLDLRRSNFGIQLILQKSSSKKESLVIKGASQTLPALSLILRVIATQLELMDQSMSGIPQTSYSVRLKESMKVK